MKKLNPTPSGRTKSPVYCRATYRDHPFVLTPSSKFRAPDRPHQHVSELQEGARAHMENVLNSL